MDSFAGMAAFVAAVDKGNYVGAARALDVSPSAIAKSVTRLERRLGVRLLNRTTRRLATTEEGRIFYERCRDILDEVREAEATMLRSREAPRGKLKVSLPNLIGRKLVLPHLGTFAARWPEVELDVMLEDRIVDIVAESVDVAIRTGDLGDSRLIARRLGPQHFVMCGTPDYFGRHGRPRHPRDLAAHRCIHYRFPSDGRLQPWPLCVGPETRLPVSLAFNNSDGILLAVLQGLGIAVLPVYVAREEVAAGRLVPVLSAFTLERGSLWLVWPSTRHLSPKVRVFSDFVVECLKAENYAFEPIVEG